MGGGGKGGGGGGGVPSQLTDAAKKQQARGKEIAGITMPILEQGAGQMKELLSTGGVGARVPLVQMAEGAQRRAASRAAMSVGENTMRGGMVGPQRTALVNQLVQQGETAANRIGPSLAAQVAQQGIGQAIGGMPLAHAGLSGAASAMTGGFMPAQGGGMSGGRALGQLAAMAGNSDMMSQIGGLFGGKSGGAAPYGATGAGMNIVGSSGMMGGGV